MLSFPEKSPQSLQLPACSANFFCFPRSERILTSHLPSSHKEQLGRAFRPNSQRYRTTPELLLLQRSVASSKVAKLAEQHSSLDLEALPVDGSPTGSRKRNASIAGLDDESINIESPDQQLGDDGGKKRPIKRACNECRQQKVRPMRKLCCRRCRCCAF